MNAIPLQPQPALLDQLVDQRQFVVYKVMPREGTTKLDKVPCDPFTGANINAQDRQHWLLPHEAALYAEGLGAGYGVGIVIYKGCGLFAIDFDQCVEQSGGWMPHVAAFLQWFPDAYHEMSVSGTGCHILGTYHGGLPDHRTRNADYRAECYTEARFIALGEHISGSVLADCTDALLRFLAAYFPPREETASAEEWRDTPMPGGTCPEDDAELISRALRSTSPQAAFGRGASFAALWTANADVLGRAFPPQSAGQAWDGSGADLALCNHLAFWTRGNHERMARLMWTCEALRRPKWDREDYFKGTILRACASQTEWYSGPADAAAVIVPAGTADVLAPSDAFVPVLARRPALPGVFTALPAELSDIRRSASGEMIPDEENIGIILERDPALQGIVRYNEFSGELILSRPVTADPSVVGERGTPRPWADEDTIVLQRFIQRYIIPKVGRDRIEAVVAQHAKHRCAFHPIRDYLQSIAWDGTPRLATWLQTYFGADRQPAEYLAAIGSAWLISGVARIFEPGCKADNALVAEGAQGIYKSTAFRTLAGNDYFSDSLSADLSHKDARDHLRGKWIIELAELSQFKRSEIETVKSFITRQVEQYRPSYGRHEISFPRQCIFAGSTNDETYLVDRTGNRRWWAASCTRVDLNALARDRDQLWAEAVHRYRAGEPWWLGKDMEALAAAEASLRVAHDPWTADVLKATTTMRGADVSPGEVLTNIPGLPTTERHDRNAGRVGQILRDLGWQRGKRHMTRGQLYVRPGAPPPPPPGVA